MYPCRRNAAASNGHGGVHARENGLMRIMSGIIQRSAGLAAPTAPGGPVNLAPAASTENTEARQAVADEFFDRPRG